MSVEHSCVQGMSKNLYGLTIVLTVNQSQSHGTIFASQDCDDRLGKSCISLQAPQLVNFLDEPSDLLIQLPDGLPARDDLVEQRVGEGEGLVRGEVRFSSHTLPEPG